MTIHFAFSTYSLNAIELNQPTDDDWRQVGEDLADIDFSDANLEVGSTSTL